MKNIAVLIHEDEGQEARLQAALDLVRALAGHLIAIDVQVPVALCDDPMLGGVGLAEMIAEDRRADARHLKRIEARLAAEDVAWTVQSAVGDIAGCLSDRVALADLVVLNTMFPGFPHGAADAIVSAVIHSGRPVLAVPREARSLAMGGVAMVAWDGSEAADAALRAAIPLLALAGEVQVVSIGRDDGRHPPELAAAYLSRQGIMAEVVGIPGHAGRAADQLLAHVCARRPSLVVMGGFGHPRLMEALFGGVTRKLLENSPAPLFLAH